ncbi:hypothetical protein H5T57_05200 [Candidatus Bipolaricaulota bacterium]|nr:hypothetical protein [Candidatus Bipolaricaulota bacterium]
MGKEEGEEGMVGGDPRRLKAGELSSQSQALAYPHPPDLHRPKKSENPGAKRSESGPRREREP